MLTVYKAMLFLPLRKCVLLIRLSNKTCASKVFLFFEFINIISINIILVYTL